MGSGHISFTKRGGSTASRRQDGYDLMAEVANNYYKDSEGWFIVTDFYADLIGHFIALGHRNTPTKGEIKSHLFYLKRKGVYERKECKAKGRKLIQYRLCCYEPPTDPSQGLMGKKPTVAKGDNYSWFESLNDDDDLGGA